MNTYAKTTWTPADIQTLAPNLSDEQAEEWLIENQKYIQERLVELGWGVIEDLLRTDGIELEADHD